MAGAGSSGAMVMPLSWRGRRSATAFPPQRGRRRRRTPRATGRRSRRFGAGRRPAALAAGAACAAAGLAACGAGCGAPGRRPAAAAARLGGGGRRLRLGDVAQALAHLGGARLDGVVLAAGGILDAGGDHRHADDAFQLFLEGGAEDDVGVGIDLLADAGRRLVDLEQGQVLAAGDRDQQAAGALHRGFVEQRIGDGRLGRLDGAAVAGGFAGAHHRLAHLAHDRADVGEVEVDQAFLDHQVGDAGDARVEHLVGHGEGVGEGGLLVGDEEEVLIGDDDQRVDAGLQFLDAGVGDAHAPGALELERLGDDADGEDAGLARGPRDDRGRPGAGAAAHAGGDEDHVRARQVIGDLVDRLLRRGASDLRLRTGAEALGDGDAHLDEAFRLGRGQGLRVGIGDHELAPDQTRSGSCC